MSDFSFVVDLAFWIVVVGAADMIFGGLAWRFSLPARVWAWPVILMGVFVLVGGLYLWDKERREAVWKLTDRQRITLQQVVRGWGTAERFPIYIHFVGGSPLAYSYAFDIFYVFRGENWPIHLDVRNNPSPKNKGLNVAVCDSLGRSSHPKENYLRDIFMDAEIPMKPGHITEQYLSPHCEIGLVIGQPPPAYERYSNVPWEVPKP